MNKIIELYDKYYSLEEIAKIVNSSRYLIKKELVKNGIEIRTHGDTISHRNQFILTPYINDVIIGELLGDGSIYPSGTTSGGFTYSTSRKKYLEWLYLQIFKKSGIDIMNEGIKESIIKPKKGFSQINDSISYKARTLSYLQFGEFRKKWYPDGEKIVPDDINITPTILLHWYLGDGSIHKKIGHHKTRGKYAYIYKYVRFHTNGFSYDQCQMLTNKLNDLGFDFGVKKHNSRGMISYQLGLNKPSIYNQKFFDFMGDCPDFIKDIYDYKWDWAVKKINRKQYYLDKSKSI